MQLQIDAGHVLHGPQSLGHVWHVSPWLQTPSPQDRGVGGRVHWVAEQFCGQLTQLQVPVAQARHAPQSPGHVWQVSP
jgi:hypothetical protein